MKKYIYLLSCILYASCIQVESVDSPTKNNPFILADEHLPTYENRIDHKEFLGQMGKEFYHKGLITYRQSCFSCHGNPEQPGTIPSSTKFWMDSLKYGNDPLAMYQTITRGRGLMAPQMQLSPKEKYEVIHFIREEFIRKNNPEQYFEISNDYLDSLPVGDTLGPAPSKYQPWAEVDYGNFLIQTYELSDDKDPPRQISGGRSPLANENYSNVNFAYKGLAIRLDKGTGGIAKGKTFVLFDMDLMRMTGFWTGEGFIDYRSILLNDEHNIYPRTVGEVLIENPIFPGWANPENNSFEDNRFKAIDGRRFGPLPKDWAKYNGLYDMKDRVIIDYQIGNTQVLESYGLGNLENKTPYLTRNVHISPHEKLFIMRIAPENTYLNWKGNAVEVVKENGYWVMKAPSSDQDQKIKILLSHDASIQDVVPEDPLDLRAISSEMPDQANPQIVESPIIQGNAEQAYSVDVFTLPLVNPWNSRMRPTGIDFMDEGKTALVSTIDGEVYKVEQISDSEGSIRWKRIATGLFQPLGIKYHNGEIYVGCRDQIVILMDLNDDEITDYYRSFNGDHQVTEHFHEFAMGLQVDDQGNFYYAKSGRHARRSLVPQHGTLIKVSMDGKSSEILANGFRAANGVCLNPDGSFYVTDQEGYWNPMNRINKVTKGGFYGNMYGFDPPEDSSDAAMVQPMMWVDMKYDRSPAELLWVDSNRWGPLNGALLNLSYGYGKVFVVYPQTVNGIEQGAMLELPVPQFPTGLMRGRINPLDGQLYVCGMSAWATSQMIQTGGVYRIRYNGKPAHVPIQIGVKKNEIRIEFSDPLDKKEAMRFDNYEINTWDLVRTRKYGSERLNTIKLEIEDILVDSKNRTVRLIVPNMNETWVMEILFTLKTEDGKPVNGQIQNTIYNLE